MAKTPFYFGPIGFGVFYTLAFMLQSITFRNIISRKTSIILAVLLNFAHFCYTPVLNYSLKIGIYPAVMLNMINIVHLAKNISYCHVMNSCKVILEKMKLNKKTDLDNLIPEQNRNELLEAFKTNGKSLFSISHYIRFMFAPTLCFQLTYPRSEHNKVRILWSLKRLFEYAVSQFLIAFIFAQYVMPLVKSANEIYLADGITIEFVSRLLKMSMPCVCIWILVFISVFHCL